jgi:hypothetical protein
MAYSNNNANTLRKAILNVFTPAVGAKSFVDVSERNMDKIRASFGLGINSLIMMRDNLPHRPIFPSCEDYSDDRPPFQIEREILSGSWNEGLYIYGHGKTKMPDMDYLLLLKNISFSQEDQLAGKLVLKEETPFLYAYLTEESLIKLWENFLVDENSARGKRLSSRKLKEKLQENYKEYISIFVDDSSNDVDEGAAMYINRVPYNIPGFNKASGLLKTILPDSQIIDEITNFAKDLITVTGWDIVLAISCDGWPSCANEWLTRDRIWPHDSLVQEITCSGFHIVPKSSPEGDFRLSFSCAETTLIANLTELQHKVLRSFKAAVKFHQNDWSEDMKKIITTYHLKTIAFWHFEKTTQDSFDEGSVATHLVLLLQELAEALRVRELPMYFMPKVNLFCDVEDPEEAVNMAENIEIFSRDHSLLIKSLESITFGFQHAHCFARSICEKVDELISKLPKGDTGEQPRVSSVEK